MRLSRRGLRAAFLALKSGGRMRFGTGSRVEPQVSLTTGGGSISIGRNAKISRGAMLIADGGKIVIGDDCSINPYTILYGHGGLCIGNGVRIAAHTVMIPSNHNFTEPDVPIKRQGMTMLGITIEDDVWIGANVTVLDGAHIATGCVIAAGAVVRGKTVPFGVYGGVPAKLLKMRGTKSADR